MAPELTKEYVKEMVATDYEWTRRAILALYEFQTEEEKAVGEAKQTNARGFNKFDAEFLSSLAKWILADRMLSTKQLKAARKALVKYSGQLVKIAEAKGA